VVYAFLTEGLDQESRDKFDMALLEGTKEGRKIQARRERAAAEEAMRFMK